MKICFDVRALQIGHENRGIGMYIHEVLEHLPADENTYIFYAFDKNNPIEKLGIEFNRPYKLIQTETIKTAVNAPKDIFKLLKLVYHRFQPLRPEHPDVFVQFDFTLGLPRWRSIKTVVIAYDLIPLIKHNEYLPTIRYAWHHSAGKKAKLRAMVRSVYYRAKYRLHYRVYKRANRLISISNATTHSFITLLGIPKDKITTVLPAPVMPSKPADHSLAERIHKPFLFYIGGTDSRKRIEDIVYAFHIARGRGDDIALVLAGNEFREVIQLPNIEARNVIMGSPYKDDIHLVGFVSDEQKLGLYQAARAFVFCTLFEGFGLPIVEAMAAGCPVISYNNSSIPEAAGEAAILVETGNYTAVAENLLALENPQLRDHLRQLGYHQAHKFSWDKTAQDIASLLNSM